MCYTEYSENRMIQHYIEYLSAGIIMSDSSSVASKHRDPTKVKLEHSFGFRFFDREELHDHNTNDVLRGKKKNYSNWYYEGTPYTKQQVCDKFGEDAIISRNMENNDINRVIETKQGQIIPMNKNDIIL